MLFYLRTTLFFFIFIFPSWADLAQETIYLTWQQSPSTTMTIQWISPARDRDSLVSYRLKSGSEEWIKSSGEFFPFPQMKNYAFHRVEIKNLQPDSVYLFKVSPSEKEYQFLTAPAQLTKEVRFVVGGDMYHDSIECMEVVSKRAAATSPLFAVLGGDIAYTVRTLHLKTQENERWIEWVKSWHKTMVTPQKNMIPVVSAIGNHDIIGQFDQTPAQAAVFSLLFPMPGKQIYNILDFTPYLSIFLLDSGHANKIGGEQTKWLDAHLEKREKIPHRFAVYHVPAYPCYRDYKNKHSVQIRESWVPLFEKRGLNIAFEHHDHAYKRSHPLLKNKIHPKGVVYLGDGGWGVEKPRKPYGNRTYLAKSAAACHFILVSITPEQELFKCIDHKGSIIDEWTKPLEKKEEFRQPQPPKTAPEIPCIPNSI